MVPIPLCETDAKPSNVPAEQMEVDDARVGSQHTVPIESQNAEKYGSGIVNVKHRNNCKRGAKRSPQVAVNAMRRTVRTSQRLHRQIKLRKSSRNFVKGTLKAIGRPSVKRRVSSVQAIAKIRRIFGKATRKFKDLTIGGGDNVVPRTSLRLQNAKRTPYRATTGAATAATTAGVKRRSVTKSNRKKSGASVRASNVTHNTSAVGSPNPCIVNRRHSFAKSNKQLTGGRTPGIRAFPIMQRDFKRKLDSLNETFMKAYNEMGELEELMNYQQVLKDLLTSNLNTYLLLL